MKSHTVGYLLDENQGQFVAEDGRKIDYHNARFYDLESKAIFKANIDDSLGLALPEAMQKVVLYIEVKAGEKFTKLVFDGFDALGDAPDLSE